MKKAVAFLLALFIFVTPVTTFVKADVVIGDNDTYAVTEIGVENGKRIATMEVFLQLLESGVTEINFNNISDLDDYLEEFYDELTNINYQDVSNEILAGAYYDVKELKKWIDDRGEYIATYYKDYLNSADNGLSNIFNEFHLKLPKTRLTGTSLNGIRSLSRFHGDTPVPSPDSNYNDYIAYINGCSNSSDINHYGKDFFWKEYPNSYFNSIYNNTYRILQNPCYEYSYFKILTDNNSLTSYYFNPPAVYVSDIVDINIYSNNGVYSFYNSITTYDNVGYFDPNYPGNCIFFKNQPNYYSFGNTNATKIYQVTGTLTDCFQYLKDNIRNVNIYVDGIPWAFVGNSTSSPILDIDGIIKLYGNDNPIQYEFPQGTQIDYNALYTTIYNAIHDNLPLDMQTINNNQVYYDSHDNIFSPTIYNYYGKDGNNENDWIDSILDYATIPDFNSVLGVINVIDNPFTNGIIILNTGVNDVIPNEILVIFGGCFVLILFVCIINKMTK